MKFNVKSLQLIRFGEQLISACVRLIQFQAWKNYKSCCFVISETDQVTCYNHQLLKDGRLLMYFIKNLNQNIDEPSRRS